MDAFKKLAKTAGGVALAIGMGTGCGGSPAKPATTTYAPAAVEAAIARSLDRLRALRLVDVDGLVTDLPAEATACYGLPCTPADQQRFDAERARQAPRLEDLVDIAEAVAGEPSMAPAPVSDSKAALRALADLRIVDVAGLVVTEPAYTGSCYGICPTDQAAADRENGLRVARVLEIADDAARAGL